MRTLFCLSSPFIKVEPSNFLFPPSTLLEDTLFVESNIAWEIINNTDFVFVTPLNGVGNKNVTISVNENFLGEGREDSITIRNTQLGLQKTIIIKQAGGGF